MANIMYSIISLILALLANFGSSFILSYLNLNQQPANDILLLITPRIAWMGYVADTVLILSTVNLLLSYRKRLLQIPFAFYSISVILFVRSVLVLLTPINNSFGHVEYWDFFSFGSYPSGMFPSGHTAFTFLAFLLLKSYSNKVYTRVAFLLFIVEVIALITSHGHYSIDIVGGLMLSYIVYRLGKDIQNKKHTNR